jgi:hypothetical protein
MTTTGFTTIDLELNKDSTILETARYLQALGFDVRDTRPMVENGKMHVKIVVVDPLFRVAGVNVLLSQFGIVKTFHIPKPIQPGQLLTTKQKKRLDELSALSADLISVTDRVKSLNLPPRFQKQLDALQLYVTQNVTNLQ